MSVQVEKLEKNMAKLTVEVSAEDFKAAIKKAFNKNKNRFSIPGFRKGKANLLFHHNLHGNLRQLRRQILFLRHFQDRIAVGTKMHTAQS